MTGVIIFKVKDVFYPCPPERIYALRIITYYAYILVFMSKLGYYKVLRVICILIFVYKYIPEHILIFLQDFRYIPEKYICIKQKVVEVHCICCPAAGLVNPEYIGYCRFPVPGVLCCYPGICSVCPRTDQVVLCRGDPPEHFTGLIYLLIKHQLFNNCLYNIF